MERLTEKHYSTDGYYMKCSKVCANDDEMCGGCPYLDKIIDRFGAYEDTGLTPEQVAALKEGKPIEAFLHPIDAYEGLKEKYLVFKADTGEKVRNCFVLRPDKDPAAIVALRAYAEVTDNENLAGDIYNWVGKDNNVPCKWIPVSERLPQVEEPEDSICEQVQVLLKNGFVTTGWCNRHYRVWWHLNHGETHFVGFNYEDTPVVAWQPLAEPPLHDYKYFIEEA